MTGRKLELELLAGLRYAGEWERECRERWQLALEARRRAIVEARQAGLTFDAIAGELGVSRGAVIAQFQAADR